jgi:hypothetical protein
LLCRLAGFFMPGPATVAGIISGFLIRACRRDFPVAEPKPLQAATAGRMDTVWMLNELWP